MLQAPVAEKLPSTVEQSNQADRIANIEKNLQSNIESMQDKIAQLSSEVNTLATTNQALTQQMTDLASKLLVSQQALEELLAAKKALPVIPKSQANMKKALHKSESLAYFVQAVIPGRAWLINSQGGTLTVRVGSKVPGWGVVHRIDALQGRVTMSSGRIIAFTQAD
jgi:intracellular multiplication protein IcmG